MSFIEFLEYTRYMKPSERSEYFNSLAQENQDSLVDQASEREMLFLQVRIIVGSEEIEKERNIFKRDKMMQVYGQLCTEYQRKRAIM